MQSDAVRDGTQASAVDGTSVVASGSAGPTERAHPVDAATDARIVATEETKEDRFMGATVASHRSEGSDRGGERNELRVHDV